ncbi:MAG: hypothetical protein ACOCZQ_00235, partial [Nanoarchaeota archaeon]
MRKEKLCKSFWKRLISKATEAFSAKRVVLEQRSYLISFIILSIIMTCLLLFFPKILNPEASLMMQLTLLNTTNYVLVIAISIMTSLLIVMQVYSYKISGSASYTKTAFSGGSAFFAAVVGTASCASCITTVFAFLGFGASAFLVKHQILIMSIAIVVIVASLYFTSLKINGECNACRIN